MSPLDDQLSTYARCAPRLLREGHRGKWVLIYHDTVAGIFESRDQGLVDGYKRFGNVPFLVREVAERRRPVLARPVCAS